MSNIIVSVVIPAYNCVDYISDAINSILNQTLKEIEVIVVEDGSNDGTLDRILQIQDPRLKILKNKENRGISYSLNKGIENSCGEYIARMDGDDIAAENRLELQLKVIKSCTADIVGTSIQTFGSFSSLWKPPEIHDDIVYLSHFQSSVFHATVLGSREVFLKYKYKSDFDGIEDYELWTRMIKAGIKFFNMQVPLYKMRVNEELRFKRDSEEKLHKRVRFLKDNLAFPIKVSEIKKLNSFCRRERLSYSELLKSLSVMKSKRKAKSNQIVLYRLVRSYFSINKNYVKERIAIFYLRL